MSQTDLISEHRVAVVVAETRLVVVMLVMTAAAGRAMMGFPMAAEIPDLTQQTASEVSHWLHPYDKTPEEQDQPTEYNLIKTKYTSK